MNLIQYHSPNLGAYIAELQYTVPVDGKMLSEADLARRARMSKTTVENVKKGSKSICMPTATSFTSIWKPAVAARFSRWNISSSVSTGALKPTVRPVTAADAVRTARRMCRHDFGTFSPCSSGPSVTPCHLKKQLLYRNTLLC